MKSSDKGAIFRECFAPSPILNKYGLFKFSSIGETSAILQGESAMSIKNHFSSLFLKPKSDFFSYVDDFC